MDFLYLSPEFPPNYAPFILQLAHHGARVWALGEADFYELPDPLRRAIRYYVRADFGSHGAVESALHRLLEAKTAAGTPPGFDVVESHNEIWLELEAHINATLNVPGIRPADLAPLKKKSAMKERFSACGLPTARGALLVDPAQGPALAKAIGLPLVLKPDEGVGAGRIYVVASAAELQKTLPKLAGSYFMEEFIAAPIVTYDGLVNREGALLFENSLAYGEGVLEYVRGKDTFFYVRRRIPQRLREIGRRLVGAFGIRRKFFHFEFFVRDGDYLPIEINCRPPGGAILDMMNYSADTDLYAAYARMITGAEEAADGGDKPYYVAYAGRRDRDYRYSHGELMERLGPALVEHGRNPALFRQAMCDYRYIVRSPNRDELLRMAADVQRLSA